MENRGTGTGVIVLVALGVGLLVLGLAAHVGRSESKASDAFSLQVVGSETMRPLVAACAESFMASNPKADVIVRGGGSGDGIASLLQGIADLGMASRGFTPKEREYATSKGVRLSMSELALDGIAVIVHRSNSLDELDIGQVKGIFSGTIANWRELGADGGKILAVARAAGSGTAALFAESVLGGESLGTATHELPTNEAIVAEVASRPAAIGYTSLGALKNAGERVKAVALRTGPASKAMAPNVDSVRSREYPLTRTLYLVGTEPQSAPIKDFVAHCTGAASQALIQRTGYVGMQAVIR